MTQTVLLGAEVELVYGKGLPKRSRIPGEFPVFGSNGQVDTHNEPLVDGPGIIVGRKGSVGEVIWSDKDFWPIDTTYYVKLKNPGDSLRYWYYQLKTLGLTKLNSHSAIPGLNRDVAYAKNVSKRTPEEQRKIANILGTIDEKIELNRRMNETLEQMGQALFRHYFIDNPETKVWKYKSIYEFADVVYGAPFKSKLFNESGNGRPLIRIRDLKTQKPGFWTTEVHSRGTVITAGDIVVGMDAEFRPHIWAAGDAWLNQRVCQFMPKENVSKLFILESIRPWLDFYERGKIGTTVIHLGKGDIDNFKIKSPPAETLARFSETADPMYDMRVKNSLEIQTLTALRDTLLPRLISGKATLN